MYTRRGGPSRSRAARCISCRRSRPSRGCSRRSRRTGSESSPATSRSPRSRSGICRSRATPRSSTSRRPSSWARSTSATSRTVGSSFRTTAGPSRSGMSTATRPSPWTTLGPATGASGTPVVQVAREPGRRAGRDGSAASRTSSRCGTSRRTPSPSTSTSTATSPSRRSDWSGDGRYLALSVYDGSLARARRRRRRAPHARGLRTGSVRARLPRLRAGRSDDRRRDLQRTRSRTNHVSIWDRSSGRVVRELDAWARRRSRSTDPERGSRSAPTTARCRSATRRRGRSSGRSVRDPWSVMNVVFSPDGDLLATSGEDATIRVFDTRAESGAQRLELRGHELLVSGLDFSPDGNRLAPPPPTASSRVGPRSRRADRDRGGRADPTLDRRRVPPVPPPRGRVRVNG